VIRNDGVVVIASFFCEAISLLCTRHRELLSRRDLFDLHPSSRASFATRSLYSAPVTASFFCDIISLFCTRRRELHLRSDLSALHPSSRASFAKRSRRLLVGLCPPQSGRVRDLISSWGSPRSHMGRPAVKSRARSGDRHERILGAGRHERVKLPSSVSHPLHGGSQLPPGEAQVYHSSLYLSLPQDPTHAWGSPRYKLL